MFSIVPPPVSQVRNCGQSNIYVEAEADPRAQTFFWSADGAANVDCTSETTVGCFGLTVVSLLNTENPSKTLTDWLFFFALFGGF